MLIRSVARGAILAGLVGLAASACDGRAQSSPSSKPAGEPAIGPALAVFDLTVGIPEKEQVGWFGSPGGRRRSFDALLKEIGVAKKDKDTKGFYVRFGSTSFGLARAQELGEALAEVRTKMPVYCHGEGFNNTTMMAAALGCTKIYLTPAGEVETVGIAAQVVYLKKLLTETLHFSIDILQVGKFKGAEEPLTREGPSDEARASLEAVLVDLRSTWLDGVRVGRGGAETVAKAAEDGPFSPLAAKDRGLIDEVGYGDDARAAAKKACGASREVSRYGSGSQQDGPELDEFLKIFAGDDSNTPQVVIIRAVGSISMGDSGGLFGGDSGITERGLNKQLKRVEDDDAIKAVVLRIDSPGGSALASDLIWHQLMKIRAKKPLIVSVGDMAASGGYYLASTADEIFADESSIVGSIGVVGGKVAFGQALESIGVHAETFPANREDPGAKARAAYESPLVAWDDATRQRVYDSMKGIYDLFLARVAEGRKITVEKVALSAEGRIFGGKEGKARGLVDTIGGLNAAVARAKERAHLPDDAPVRVYAGVPHLADILGCGGDGAESTAPVGPVSSVSSAITSPVIGLVERTLPGVTTFAFALEPLSGGEHTVCALPYALVVR
ncbi:signal peptide peptidase SppA [soil metagenome]